MEKGKSLCWVCEKPIKGGVFSPHIYSGGAATSTCDKCATHTFVLKGNILEELNNQPKYV